MDQTAAKPARVAYFSMEIAVDMAMPTYAGGLGVLAGDTLRAAADQGAPIVAVTLLYRKGNFRQHLDTHGNQTESPVSWNPESFLEELPERVSITIAGRTVEIRTWRAMITGIGDHHIPVYHLDTALPGNDSFAQGLTGMLYGGDARYRLAQEMVLGIGGIAMLAELSHGEIETYHMNEGHSALLGAALLEQELSRTDPAVSRDDAKAAVRRRCVFTTHTPVPAGSDRFPMSLVNEMLGRRWEPVLSGLDCGLDGILNMTYLGLAVSHYINGVSLRHEEIADSMYPAYPINSITNGVHASTWIAEPFAELFDRRLPEWRRDNLYLRYAVHLPLEEIQSAHAASKQLLIDEVARRTGIRLNTSALTIGFARRAATYKRADLVFADLDRLREIARRVGPIQFIFSGKAHPQDEGGKDIIRRVFRAAAELGPDVPVVYLEDYDMELAKLICAGCDIWLNTPQKPQEASGTSGMKAALNGVPSFSILDGWWVEGNLEGVTGWSIGDGWATESDTGREVASLYNKLEYVIGPLYYSRPDAYADVCRAAIAVNGSFYNAQRMLRQYQQNAYRLDE